MAYVAFWCFMVVVVVVPLYLKYRENIVKLKIEQSAEVYKKELRQTVSGEFERITGILSQIVQDVRTITQKSTDIDKRLSDVEAEIRIIKSANEKLKY